MARVVITIEQLKNLPESEIAEMTDNELERVLKQAAKSVGRRVNTILRSGEYSYALSNLIGDKYDTINTPSDAKEIISEYREVYNPKRINTLTRNQKIYDLMNLQSFVQSQSSTVTGIRKLNKEQDIRIFGEKRNLMGKPTGKPLHTMTQEQRRKFWKLYSEYNNQTKALARYGSSRIQEILGQNVYKQSFEDLNYQEIFNIIENELAEESGYGYRPENWKGGEFNAHTI